MKASALIIALLEATDDGQADADIPDALALSVITVATANAS